MGHAPPVEKATLRTSERSTERPTRGEWGGTDKEQRHDKAFRSTRSADEKEGEPDTQYHTKSLELEG